MSDEKSLSVLFEAAIEIESPEERADFVRQQCGDNEKLRQELELMLRSDAQVGDFLEESPSLVTRPKETQPQPPEPSNSDAHSNSPSLSERSEEFGEGRSPSDGEGPQIDLSASHSVLARLDQTIDVPRVLLQDTDLTQPDRVEPMQDPSSNEIPNRDSSSRYQLQGEIARGGMGAIIKGRDVDLGRDLAIKVLLDEHKARPEVIQRFIEEAQIGGQLQHPGIAPVYELGQFDDQRPFFSMKLVKGTTLAKLLAEREDPTQDRARFLGIFEHVCQTVGYAHARGVIHRDLKPANIMVGSFGEVQVMDWGLAKVLPNGGVADEKAAKNMSKQTEEDITVLKTRRSAGSDVPGLPGSNASSSSEAGKGSGSGGGSGSSDTQMGSVMGTPAYMPPEQALGEIDQLNQRSDVFGLGAILCEILTGQPPYVGDDTTAVFRLASRGDLEEANERLAACGADPELIALTRQCLESKPSKRPASGGVLAESVTDYLESVESKLRQSEVQRAAESARAVEQQKRMQLGLAMAAAVLLALGIGIAGTTWQWQQAVAARGKAEASAQEAIEANEAKTQALAQVTTEKELAEQARDEATSLADFLTDIFQGPDPFQGPESQTEVTIDPQQLKVVDLLIPAASRLESSFESQPARRASLQAVLAKTYHGIGWYDKAIEIREQVRDYYLAKLGTEHPDTLIAIFDLEQSYSASGRYDEAQQLAEKVFDIRSNILGPEAPETLIAKRTLASAYWLAGRQDEGRELLEEALAQLRALLGEDDPETVTAMSALAWAYASAGRYDEAIAMQEQCLQLSRKLLGGKHPDTLLAISRLASSHREAGHYDKAIDLQEQCLELRREVLGEEHPATLGSIYSLAKSHQGASRNDEAILLLEHCLDLRRKVLGKEHPTTLYTINTLAFSYNEDGRTQEAIKLGEQCLELSRRVLGEEHPGTLMSINSLAASYYYAAQFDKAIELQKQALDLSREVLGEEHPDTLQMMSNLAIHYSEAGRYDDAIELQDPCLVLLRRVVGKEHPDTLKAVDLLAGYYQKVGRLEEAIALREELLPLEQKVLGPEHRDTLGLMTNLARLYFRAKKLDQAIELQERALEIKRRVLPPAHNYRLISMSNLSAMYRAKGQIDKAIQLQEEVHEIEKNTLGEDHPNTLMNLSQLARSYQAAGRIGEAIDLTEELVLVSKKVLGPDHPQTLSRMTYLASTYFNVGRFGEAIELFETQMKLSPDSVQTFNGPAWTVATTPASDGTYPYADKAVEWARKACELDPGNGMWENTLGVACYRAEMWKDSIEALTNSTQHGFDVAHNWLFIAMSHWQLDEKDKAKQWYDTSLAWKAENTDELKGDADLQSFFAEAEELMGSTSSTESPAAEPTEQSLGPNEQSTDASEPESSDAEPSKEPPADATQTEKETDKADTDRPDTQQ